MSNKKTTIDNKELSKDLDALEKRLNAAKSRHAPPPDKSDQGNALGQAWRMSTEMVVAVLVGLFLGKFLDKFFGTEPWLLLVGVVFGFAAGIMNVMRTADKMDAANAHIPIGDDLPYEDDEDEDK